MDTFEINDCLKKTKGFVGTFACNLIPDPLPAQCYFVVNTSPWIESKSSTQGSHWIAIAFNNKGNATYFDSFGMQPMQAHIINYLENHCENSYKYNTQTLQSPSSAVCGAYCIDFVKQSASGSSLRSYVSQFTSSPLANDRFVVHRSCRSLTQQPHLQLKLKTLLSSPS